MYLFLEDSKNNQGIQIADLLASGVRRCLRSEFSRNDEVSKLLGSLMISQKYREPPIALIGFEDKTMKNSSAYQPVKHMINFSRSVIK